MKYQYYIYAGIAVFLIILFTKLSAGIVDAVGLTTSKEEQKLNETFTTLFSFPTWIRSTSWVKKNYPELINNKTGKIDDTIKNKVASIYVKFKSAGNSVDRDEVQIINEVGKLKTRGERALFIKYSEDDKRSFLTEIEEVLNEAEKKRLLNLLKSK